MQDIKDTIAVQGNDGNWDYSPYMHGMFNGMELQNSIVEGRDPEFREAPDTYLEDKAKDIPKDAEWAKPQPGKTAGRHSAPEESDAEFWARQPDVLDLTEGSMDHDTYGDVKSTAFEHGQGAACETCYLKYGVGWRDRSGHDRAVNDDHEFKPFPKPARFSALHKR